MVVVYNHNQILDVAVPEELPLPVPDNNIGDNSVPLRVHRQAAGAGPPPLEPCRHRHLPRPLQHHLHPSPLVHGADDPDRPGAGAPAVGVRTDKHHAEVLPDLPCIQAGEDAPLLVVQPLRPEHGPPLPLDQHLHRLPQPQVLPPHALLHHPAHPHQRPRLPPRPPRPHRPPQGPQRRTHRLGGRDHRGGNPQRGHHGHDRPLLQVPPRAGAGQPDHPGDPRAQEAGQGPLAGTLLVQPRSILQLGAGVRPKQLQLVAPPLPALRGPRRRRSHLAQAPQPLTHFQPTPTSIIFNMSQPQTEEEYIELVSRQAEQQENEEVPTHADTLDRHRRAARSLYEKERFYIFLLIFLVVSYVAVKMFPQQLGLAPSSSPAPDEL